MRGEWILHSASPRRSAFKTLSPDTCGRVSARVRERACWGARGAKHLAVITENRSMDHGAEIPSWVALLERRDGLIGQLRHGVPAGWPEAVGHFVAGLKAEE